VDRRWLGGQEPNPDAEFRLFCLPYAGGGASVYRGWQPLAPERIQVCPVELPGRGVRLRETPYVRLHPLVRALVTALEPFVDRPFALFGHSMGGLVGFELARALRERGQPQPAHVFVSATAAPGTPPTRPSIHDAPDAEIKRRLRTLNGTPQELLDNEELMELMLPTLRADFSVLETYEYREAPPLSVPITVFGGVADPVVPQEALRGWQRQSSKGARLRMFPGDHFFPHTSTPELVAAIAHTLDVDAVVGQFPRPADRVRG
jgi:medium-chain acyl-[acyl-carrier-protein] hydrolase